MEEIETVKVHLSISFRAALSRDSLIAMSSSQGYLDFDPTTAAALWL